MKDEYKNDALGFPALKANLDSAQTILADANKNRRRLKCSKVLLQKDELLKISTVAATQLDVMHDKCKSSLAAPPSRID